jgi:hypothetical protein
MCSGFQGDEDAYVEDCNLFERVIFVVTSLLFRLRRTENLGKSSPHDSGWDSPSHVICAVCCTYVSGAFCFFLKPSLVLCT